MKKIILAFASILFILSATAQDTWTQESSLPNGDGRYYATAFSIGHYAFVGGGQIGSPSSPTYLNDFWKWNQHTNIWTQIADYPASAGTSMVSFTINGVGYAGLGASPAINTELWAYDTVNGWTQKASFPGRSRYGAFAFVIGTNAYIGCGDPGGAPYLQDVWEYKSVENIWIQKGNFPYDCAATTSFATGKNGYVGGGGDDYGDFYNSFYQYDTTYDSWTAIAPLPVELAGSVAFTIGGKGFVGTGFNSGGLLVSTKQFWMYDTISNSWTSIANFGGVSRNSAVAFSIGNLGYLATGYDSLNNSLNDLWKYAPSTTGIDEIATSSVNINLYPNPSNGMMNLVYSGNIDKGQIEITDVMGRVVDSHEIMGTQGQITMNESTLSNGIYFYQVIGSGIMITSGKFVIAK